MKHDTLPGTSFPLGATVHPHGVNFCVFSHHGESVELLLFDDTESSGPSRTVRLDPVLNRTANYWHVFLPGMRSGQLYAYRVHGPFAPASGLRFDGKKVLLDPYGREVAAGKHYDRNAAVMPGDNCACAMKSVVVDRPPMTGRATCRSTGPIPRRSFTSCTWGASRAIRIPASRLHNRGTYGGIVEKIPYLADLGITAVELLPVQHFDNQDAPKDLANYWGYSPLAFFAPHSGYSSRREPLGPSTEFRDMVKALHKAGIEVILDVVFNHTAEGNRKRAHLLVPRHRRPRLLHT